LLWDSILCQFPIGSLLVARYGEFSEVGYRKAQPTRSNAFMDTLVTDDDVMYILVDGQQRLNAISLGFLPYHPDSLFRLWVELTPSKNPTQRQFEFYLCTRDNPFAVSYRRTKNAGHIPLLSWMAKMK